MVGFIAFILMCVPYVFLTVLYAYNALSFTPSQTNASMQVLDEHADAPQEETIRVSIRLPVSVHTRYGMCDLT